MIDISQRTDPAKDVINRVGNLTGAKEHVGDRATNEWIADMLGIYRKITGWEIGTSISESGETGGPLIRFLVEAGRPIGVEMSADAWRSRFRAILGSST